MKNSIRFLCLALCLCLLALPGLAEAPEGMTAYEAAGVPYYIWSDWTEPMVNGNNTFFYRTINNPYEGVVMITVHDGSEITVPKTDADINEVLDSYVSGVAESMDTAGTIEPLEIGGRTGRYFYGTFNESETAIGMCCYVTVTETAMVMISIGSSANNEAEARPQLFEILGIEAK